MSKIKLTGFIVLSSLSLNSTADVTGGRIEVASSFNPVGSGARALGMGGAFISIADDATAASWNPGALIQLRKPEFSAVGGGFHRIEDNTFSEFPEASGEQDVAIPGLNYLSASYPCSQEHCGKNMIFSVNYQNLYNFDKDWSFPVNSQSDRRISNKKFDFEQQGDLYALGLSYAIEVFEGFSFGFTLNYWGDTIYKNRWEQKYHTVENTKVTTGGLNATFNLDRSRTETFDFSGFNANVGMFWQAYQKDEEKLTLGFVLKTPFRADVKRRIDGNETASFDGTPGTSSSFKESYNEKMDMPLSFGFGVSYQFSDNFTLAGDVYRTSWDDFIRIDNDGNKTSAISNLPDSKSDVEATYQVRLGGEYRIISQKFGENYIIPIRAGLFYDPAPAEDGTDDFYGVSIGSGIAFETFVFDIAYQFRAAQDVGEYILTEDGFSQDVYEHTIYSSLAVRF